MTTPEFSRPVRVETIGDQAESLSIAADPAECEALARRFGLEAIESLTADIALSREAEEVRAEGTLRARVVQTCVATAESVPAEVDETFALRFRPARPTAAEAEVELAPADLDVEEYEGGSIDLGEAVAETLAISLDPYPRASGAEEALKAAGVMSEEEAGPFAALAALKEKMAKKE